MSFLQELFAQAAPGQSPYTFAADTLSKVLPEKARWFFWMLAIGSVVNALNLVANLVCIYMLGARRKLGGISPYWIARLRYDHSSGIPYLVPNAVMTFLLFNGIFALLMQPYIWINYVSYMDRTRATASHSGLYFWYGFIFIFDGSGMWISAFGTFYATLLPQLLVSNKISNSKFFVHPVFLNTLCYGLPVALFITQVATSALSQIAWRDLLFLQFDIVDRLELLDQQWVASNGTTVDSALLEDTLRTAEPLLGALAASRAAFVRNAMTCGVWYLLCFLFFTPSAIWLLYVLHRTVTHKLQFVTQMPTSDVDIQFQVPLHEFARSRSRVGLGGIVQTRSSREDKQPASLCQPPSYLSAGEGHGGQDLGSGETTPTSAAPLALTEHAEVVLPPGAEEEEFPEGYVRDERRSGLGNERDHSYRPHDPGGQWELNVGSSSKTAKKLQTAYYSAMLQFAVTGFCLAVATGSWIWVAVDTRVMYSPTLHAVAVLLTVWVYSVIGIIVNVFICVRLRAIGFKLPRSKIMSYLHEVWASNSSRGRA